MLKTIEETKKELASVGYYADNKTAAAISVMLFCEKPLLIEGDPGVGKTFLAEATSKMLDIPLVRLQMYEGLTDDKVLYDYDYQRQLLTLEAIKPKLEDEYAEYNSKEMISAIANSLDFYGPDFLIKRPVLKSIDGDGKKVLLIDEIDKAPEEVEYMLYEFLENYSITIPQYGEISCDPEIKPIVFLTSNNYRELSDAIKRRCNYLYIDKKTKDDIVEILKMTTQIDEKFAEKIAIFQTVLSEENGIKKLPSLSELIEWSKFIKNTGNDIKEFALTMIVKEQKDREKISKLYDKVFTEDEKVE